MFQTFGHCTEVSDDLLCQDVQGVEEVEISIKRPAQEAVTYLMRMGDERILAPLAAFFPDMFGLEGSQLFHRSEKLVSDPTDPNDDDYLERTMSRHELVCSVYLLTCC